MMDYLIGMAEDLRETLQERLRHALGDNRIQGALLEVDRFWAEGYLRTQFPWSPWDSYGPGFDDIGHLLQRVSVFSPIQWDFEFRPDGWDTHCSALGYKYGDKPIVIRVILRYPKRGSMEDWPREHEGHPIVYEYRPPVVATSMLSILSEHLQNLEQRFMPARLSSSIGRADPKTAGTLGGYLRNPDNGAIYFVSCQHVLGPVGTRVYSPGPYEGHQCSYVATVVSAELPPPSMPGSDCNFFAVPNVGRLDFAVAELRHDGAASELVPEKSVDTLRNPERMSPYQRVDIYGKESGRVEAQLTAVTIWHELLFEDPLGNYIPHCFGTLFEMSDLMGGSAELVKPGDSGAWVIDDVDGLRLWNGMLIGRLGSRGYGCYAQFIMDACNSDPQLQGGLALL